jgi:hypothetical protein
MNEKTRGPWSAGLRMTHSDQLPNDERLIFNGSV